MTVAQLACIRDAPPHCMNLYLTHVRTSRMKFFGCFVGEHPTRFAKHVSSIEMPTRKYTLDYHRSAANPIFEYTEEIIMYLKRMVKKLDWRRSLPQLYMALHRGATSAYSENHSCPARTIRFCAYRYEAEPPSDVIETFIADLISGLADNVETLVLPFSSDGTTDDVRRKMRFHAYRTLRVIIITLASRIIT